MYLDTSLCYDLVEQPVKKLKAQVNINSEKEIHAAKKEHEQR